MFNICGYCRKDEDAGCRCVTLTPEAFQDRIQKERIQLLEEFAKELEVAAARCKDEGWYDMVRDYETAAHRVKVKLVAVREGKE